MIGSAAMGDLGKDVSQLSLGVNITLVRVMCGSPAGMKNLIKYFESQSKRLDRQTIHSQPSSLNSNFESMIKFKGVPILPPALTSSRRDELKQYKKDAILLEKRQKARQRKQLLAKADSLVTESQSQMTFPEMNSRPTARQLNFDSGGQEEITGPSTLKDRLGATNPFSTFATAETGMMEDFGLQTLDSVNSDFMSLDGASVPAVFNGLALTSFKEQKISYDLDRLSKVLNLQELTSTSGSDLSDALGNTQNLDEEDLQSAEKLAQKFLVQRAGERGDGQSTSFFHESQDTVVEVSPEAGCERASADNTSTSGFVDNTNSSNQEQNSVGSSPSCGSANTTGTLDSQRSNRSSPKSLKNAVHFASFVTEYINTSASQSFERPTIVKKKISNDQIQDDPGNDGNSFSNPVLPIIGDPGEARQKHLLSRKVSDSESSVSSGGLLNRVSFNPDSDASPNTPPFDASTGMPFQSYGRSESYSSDKENDGTKTHKNIPHGHKKSSEHGGRERHQGNGEESQHRGRQGKINGGTSSKKEDGNKPNLSSVSYSDSQFSVQSSIASAGVGPQDLQTLSTSGNVGASQASSSSDFPVAVSTSQVSLGVSSGVVSVGQASVSDSQGSNKSNTLTGTSESSNSTIREDISARDSGNLALNIVESGHGSVHLEPDMKQKPATLSKEEESKSKNNFESSKISGANDQSHSPKKLNTDNSNTHADVKDDVKTPPPSLVRRGSYTLSEPSPALVKVRSRLAEEREKEEKQMTKTETRNSKAVESKEKIGVKKPAEKQIRAGSSRQTMQTVETKPSNFSVPTDTEREGKAEHINKYLNQVQFQNSMNFSSNSWEVGQMDGDEEGSEFQGEEASETDVYNLQHDNIGDDEDPNLSVLDVLRSLAESQGSLEQLSVQELLALHQQQMDEKRQALIALQQKDMEELFVQQRREVMLLETEIKAAQQLEKDQQEFLIQNAPENIKVKARNHDGELSPEHSGNYNEEIDEDQVRMSVIKESINSLDNRRHQSLHQFNDANHQTSVPSLHLQPKSYPQGNTKSGKVGFGKSKLNSKQNYVNFSPNSINDECQTAVKRLDDSFSPRAEPLKDPIGISNRIPEFSPSVSSPRMHRPAVVRSPLKYVGIQRREGRLVVPPEANFPEMQQKFSKVSAVAKGFLTRCLLRSDKVQELIKTIKDTREFAFNFQTETPIKKGVFSSQDRALLERIVAQLQAALLDIHEIFFELPCSERMALIAQTRIKENEKRIKASKDSMRGSGPRMSQATLKALERKRKAKEAEASAMLSTSRPKTAPPSTSSPRCKNHTDVRALKPIQGQSFSQISPVRPDTSRSEKERPRTAPEKTITRPKRVTAPSSKPATASSQADVNKDTQKDGPNKHAANLSSKTVVMKSKVGPAKPSSSRPTKSWR